MMSSQINNEPVTSGYNKLGEDTRLTRNVQEDMHMAVDLTYEYLEKLKSLHPLANRHIKILLTQGNML